MFNFFQYFVRPFMNLIRPSCMNIKLSSSFAILLFGFVFAFIMYFLRSLIDANPIVADGYQNLSTAKNILDHFVFSSAETDGLSPSADMVREPAWPFLNAIYLYFLSLDYSLAILATEFSNYFKFFTLVLYALIGSACCCWIFIKTKKLTFVFFVLALFLLIYGTTPRLINNYNNEALATLFLLTSSILYSEAILIKNGKKGGAVLSALLGLVIGLLALTKAQYLFICVPMFFVFFYFNRKNTLLAITIFIMVVSPWIFRNYQLFNQLAIAERGKTVATVRVVLTSEPSSEERMCMAYAFTHPFLQHYLNKTLGINNSDFDRGNKCQRLNRETCFDMGTKKVKCSAFAEDASLQYLSNIQLFYKAYHAGQEMEKGKLNFFDFFRPSSQFIITYIKTFPLFAWRGMSFSDFPVVAIIISISTLLLLFTRYWSFSLLGTSSWFFHVALTHNIPRYHATLFPIMIISFVLLIYLGLINSKYSVMKKLFNFKFNK